MHVALDDESVAFVPINVDERKLAPLRRDRRAVPDGS